MSNVWISKVWTLTSCVLAGLAGCGVSFAPMPDGTGPAPVLTSGDGAPHGSESRDLINAALSEAVVAWQARDDERAIAIFRRILAYDPTVVQACVGLGRIHLVRGEYALAEPSLSRAARLDPRNYHANYGLGQVLEIRERWPDAVRAYHRALTIRPDSVEANTHMATTYMKMGAVPGARVFAEKVVELDPSNGEARAELAVIYRTLGRNEDAVEQYRAAVEILGPSPSLLRTLIERE